MFAKNMGKSQFFIKLSRLVKTRIQTPVDELEIFFIGFGPSFVPGAPE